MKLAYNDKISDPLNFITSGLDCNWSITYVVPEKKIKI